MNKWFEENLKFQFTSMEALVKKSMSSIEKELRQDYKREITSYNNAINCIYDIFSLRNKNNGATPPGREAQQKGHFETLIKNLKGNDEAIHSFCTAIGDQYEFVDDVQKENIYNNLESLINVLAQTLDEIQKVDEWKTQNETQLIIILLVKNLLVSENNADDDANTLNLSCVKVLLKFMDINLTKDIDINNSVQRQLGSISSSPPKTPAKTSSSKNSAQKKAGDDIKFYLYLDYRMFQINKKFKTTLIQINTLEDLSDILDNRMKNTIADIKSSVSNIENDVTISSSIHSKMFQKGVDKLIQSVQKKIKAEEEPDEVIMAQVVDADDVVKKVEEIDLQEQLTQQQQANTALQEQLTHQQQVNADLQEQHQQVNADLQEQHQQANADLQEQLTQQQQAIAALQDELATALKDINQYQRGAKEKETTTGKRKGR